MNKRVIRCVALLLTPCLISDPVGAAAFVSLPISRLSPAPKTFESQAFVLALTTARKLTPKQALIGRLARLRWPLESMPAQILSEGSVLPGYLRWRGFNKPLLMAKANGNLGDRTARSSIGKQPGLPEIARKTWTDAALVSGMFTLGAMLYNFDLPHFREQMDHFQALSGTLSIWLGHLIRTHIPSLQQSSPNYTAGYLFVFGALQPLAEMAAASTLYHLRSRRPTLLNAAYHGIATVIFYAVFARPVLDVIGLILGFDSQYQISSGFAAWRGFWWMERVSSDLTPLPGNNAFAKFTWGDITQTALFSAALIVGAFTLGRGLARASRWAARRFQRYREKAAQPAAPDPAPARKDAAARRQAQAEAEREARRQFDAHQQEQARETNRQTEALKRQATDALNLSLDLLAAMDDVLKDIHALSGDSPEGVDALTETVATIRQELAESERKRASILAELAKVFKSAAEKANGTDIFAHFQAKAQEFTHERTRIQGEAKARRRAMRRAEEEAARLRALAAAEAEAEANRRAADAAARRREEAAKAQAREEGAYQAAVQALEDGRFQAALTLLDEAGDGGRVGQLRGEIKLEIDTLAKDTERVRKDRERLEQADQRLAAASRHRLTGFKWKTANANAALEQAYHAAQMRARSKPPAPMAPPPPKPEQAAPAQDTPASVASTRMQNKLEDLGRSAARKIAKTFVGKISRAQLADCEALLASMFSQEIARGRTRVRGEELTGLSTTFGLPAKDFKKFHKAVERALQEAKEIWDAFKHSMNLLMLFFPLLLPAGIAIYLHGHSAHSIQWVAGLPLIAFPMEPAAKSRRREILAAA
jgi:hypothetical protein